jgi:hypothetical protein
VSANPANPDEEIVLGVALVGRPVSTRIVLSLEACRRGGLARRGLRHGDQAQGAAMTSNAPIVPLPGETGDG